MWTIDGESKSEVELARDQDGSPGKRVLITGGTGFIGGRLAERLVEEKSATVHILARDIEKADRLERQGFRVTVGDLNDQEALREAVKGCELVYHCAHTFGLGMADAIRVNVGGTRNVLQAAYDAGVSLFIYLSSVAVYGQTPMNGTDEKVEIRLTGEPYADSKIEAEKEVLRFSEKNEFPVVILRPAIVYGPRSAFWSLGIVHSIKAKHPMVIGNGDGICNNLYVDNLVDAMIQAAELEVAVGEAFIITDGSPCTWGEFIGYYARMLGMVFPPSCSRTLAYITSTIGYPFHLMLRALRNTPSWEPARFLVRGTRLFFRIANELFLRICAFTPDALKYFTHKAAYDISKARSLLGYDPEVGLEEGMAKTEAWLRENGHL